MKQFLLLILFIPLFNFCFAQEDSLTVVRQFSGAGEGPGTFPLAGMEMYRTPELSLYSTIPSESLNLKIEIPSLYQYQQLNSPANSLGTVYLYPFLSSWSINSAASYRLNDRMTLSGSSFSANSAFSPNSFSLDPSKMDIQGINFELNYKVSDKVRIGAGFQIHSQPYMP